MRAYRFIEGNREEFGLRWLLGRTGILPNAYYNWQRQARKGYRQRKEDILGKISAIYHETGGILGHRSMRIFLKRDGISLSKTTVHKYMNRELRLLSICRRKKPGYRKGRPHKVFPNLLGQDFAVQGKNRVWCTDFTYLYLTTGEIRYNCTVLDLYDRSVVGSETGRWISTELAIKAMDKALHAQGEVPQGLILHSDQGSQFTSRKFTEYCLEHGITQSMSKSGCPYDNAPMERYYNSLKEELVNRYYFRTDDELRNAVAEYAFGWYNLVRPHSHNGYLTPHEKRFGTS